MAECLKCKISFDYGIKYCGQCGSPLIETKDIFNEAVKLFNDGKKEVAYQKIIEIPTFSFFYEKSVLLKAKIYSEQGKLKDLSELLNEKQSWLKIDFEERKELKRLFLEQIKNENANRNYNMSLELLDSMSSIEYEGKEEAKILKAETYYLKGKEFYDEKSYNDALKQLRLASEYSNPEADVLSAQIHFIKSKEYLSTNKLGSASSEIDKALKTYPDNADYKELKVVIADKRESKKSKLKKKIIVRAVSLVIIIIVFFLAWIFSHGNLLIYGSPSSGESDVIIKIDNELVIDKEQVIISDKKYISITSLFIGSYDIEIILDKYKTFKTSVDIKGNSENLLNYELTPKTGILNITSEPTGMYIYINNIPYGKTPNKISDLNVGRYNIKLAGSDYQDKNYVDVSIVEDKTKDIHTQMEKVEDRTVDIRTQIEKVEPRTKDLHSKTEKVQNPINTSVDIKDNSDNLLNSELAPKTGIINITSEPSGMYIYINNKPYGKTPNKISDLIQGGYNIRLEGSGYQDKIYSYVIIFDDKVKDLHTQMEKVQSPMGEYKNSMGIQIISATYGLNCGAPKGNVTAQVAEYCNGKSSCTYIIDYKILGDPAYLCKKNFVVEWKCGDNPVIHRAEVKPEAGFKKKVYLYCDK